MSRKHALTALAATFLVHWAASAGADERLYVGVWTPGTGANFLTAPRSRAAFVEVGGTLTQRGLRLIDVESFPTPGGRRYVGVWRSGFGTNLFDGPLGVIDFREQREEFFDNGLRLVDFEFFRNNGQRFLAVWRNGQGDERLSGPLQLDAFLSRGEALTQEGLRLEDVEVQQSSGTTLYRGLWREGSGSNMFVGPRSRGAFVEQLSEMAGAGLQLVDVELVPNSGSQHYAGVFRNGPNLNALSTPRDLGAFFAFGEEQAARNLRLIDVEIITIPDETPGPGGGGEPRMPPGTVEAPGWVEFSSGTRVDVDFTPNDEAGFRIRLPTQFLSDLPVVGETIAVPDQMCGLRISHPIRFDWTEDGQPVLDDILFNRQPEDDPATPSVDEEAAFWQTGETEPFFLDGVNFTGPIGACADDNAWSFPFPFTSTDEGQTAPQRELVLSIALAGDSEIKYLQSSSPHAEVLSADELFGEDEDFDKAVEDILEVFELTHDEEASGICGVINHLINACEANPLECPKIEKAVEANC